MKLIDPEELKNDQRFSLTNDQIRKLRIKETEMNLERLAQSKARLEGMKETLNPMSYEAMAIALEDARIELQALLNDLKFNRI